MGRAIKQSQKVEERSGIKLTDYTQSGVSESSRTVVIQGVNAKVLGQGVL